MKKVLSLFCALTLALAVSAQSLVIDKPAKVQLPQGAFTANTLKKSQAAKAVDAAKWDSIGLATVTEAFGHLFGNPEQTYLVPVYASKTTAGLYAVANSWYDKNANSAEIIEIHAENPNLCYILPTSLTFTNNNYGFLQTFSKGGYYLSKYPSYTAESIAAAIEDDTDAVWGKKVKNIISFTEEAMLACLTAYNNGAPLVGKAFTVVLPDLEAPVISAVNVEAVGDDRAIVAITATDDVEEVDGLTFTVKNGDNVLLANGKTSNGKLTITGLQKSTEYNLTLIATDNANHASEPFAFSFTTLAESDHEAPVITKAEIQGVADKWVAFTVQATDNQTPAADIVFELAFNGNEPIYMKADEGVININGLTPQTAYSVVITAIDQLGNRSTPANAINFTTLELIPVVLNVTWLEAAYLSEYSKEGAHDFEITFSDSDAEISATLDTYTLSNNAISGTWSTENNTIAAEYSYVTNKGTKLKVLSATETLQFVRMDQANEGMAVYNASFEAMCSDGNLYKGTAELTAYTYDAKTNDHVPMTGETTTAISNLTNETKAIKTIENGQVVIINNGVKRNILGAPIQ